MSSSARPMAATPIPALSLPFGMVAFSPEETPLPGRNYPIAAPGGYEWRVNGIKGFSLTHLSGTGCTGASGDIPIMPITKDVALSPSADDGFVMYSSYFSHDDEHASPGSYKVALANGVTVDLSATLRIRLCTLRMAEGQTGQSSVPHLGFRNRQQRCEREGRCREARSHRLGHQREFLRLSLARPPRELLHALFRRRVRSALQARRRVAGYGAHPRRDAKRMAARAMAIAAIRRGARDRARGSPSIRRSRPSSICASASPM